MTTSLPEGITPRLLSEAAAAEYIGLTDRSFRKLVANGTFEPIQFNDIRRNLYDRCALDAYLDGLSGLNNLDENIVKVEAKRTAIKNFRDNLNKRKESVSR